jgi:hypothetical protein
LCSQFDADSELLRQHIRLLTHFYEGASDSSGKNFMILPKLGQSSKRSLQSAHLAACILLLVASAIAEAPGIPARSLWQDPGNISSRDLFYGSGGKDHEPEPPVQYVGDATGGTNPKFDATDRSGNKWRVKLGIESKPEIAASRLLWAVGYFSNDNYYVAELQVDALKHERRWKQFMKADGMLTGARLQHAHDGEKKTGDWSWRHNPFKGSREFDGLRVMMALISNWDLKDDNNAILEEKEHPAHQLYEVTDLGTAFGTSGKSYTSDESKSNLEAYRHHKFVGKVHEKYVDLNFPTHPSIIHFLEFPFLWRQMRNRWIGRHIPREHVKWIASLLAQLKPNQIRDAFRAAGYSPDEVESFSQAVEIRVADLEKI